MRIIQTERSTTSVFVSSRILNREKWESWVSDRIDPAMQDIREQAMEYLPGEFTDIAEAFRKACGQRTEAWEKTGACGSILSPEERNSLE